MFSVIVTTKDSAAGLKRTLRSVRSQLYPPSEVIVVDHGQCCDAELLVSDFRKRSDIPLKYLRRPGFDRGAACNLGILETTGRYLTFLAAQDELLPFALEQYTQVFQQVSGVDVCYGRYILRDRAGKLSPSYDKRLPEGKLIEPLYRGDLIIVPSAMACTREIFDAGRHFPSNPCGMEAMELLLCLARDHHFCCVQEDVVIVENRTNELPPEHFSSRCHLWERLAGQLSSQIAAGSIAEGLANVSYEAALAWWKAGNAGAAARHLEVALRYAPRRMRFWWLAGLLRSQALLGARRQAG